jgi:2'-hydroxyisoflavone reductase
MRILIVGGTRFVGRHITEAALAAGHEVAVLHRGQSGADLFPRPSTFAGRPQRRSERAERHPVGCHDRRHRLPAQAGHQISRRRSSGNGGQYVYISSVSVYEPPAQPEYSEDSPVQRLPAGQVPDVVDAETYGPLKVLCEEAAVESFGPGTLVIRPTYVIGPYDHSGDSPTGCSGSGGAARCLLRGIRTVRSS